MEFLPSLLFIGVMWYLVSKQMRGMGGMGGFGGPGRHGVDWLSAPTLDVSDWGMLSNRPHGHSFEHLVLCGIWSASRCVAWVVLADVVSRLCTGCECRCCVQGRAVVQQCLQLCSTVCTWLECFRMRMLVGCAVDWWQMREAAHCHKTSCACHVAFATTPLRIGFSCLLCMCRRSLESHGWRQEWQWRPWWWRILWHGQGQCDQCGPESQGQGECGGFEPFEMVHGSLF